MINVSKKTLPFLGVFIHVFFMVKELILFLVVPRWWWSPAVVKASSSFFFVHGCKGV